VRSILAEIAATMDHCPDRSANFRNGGKGLDEGYSVRSHRKQDERGIRRIACASTGKRSDYRQRRPNFADLIGILGRTRDRSPYYQHPTPSTSSSAIE